MKINKKLMAHPVLVSSTVTALVIVVGIFAYFGLTKSPHFDYVKAEKRNLTEMVFTNGEVKSSKDVNASFEISGKVSNVLVSMGDKVYEGQPLIRLVSDDAYVNLTQAKAALASAESQYDITKTQSSNSKMTFDEASKNLNSRILTSYDTADDIIRNNIDQLFSNPKSDFPTFLLSINDSSLSNDIVNKRVELEKILKDWNNNISTITADKVLSNLNKINSFLSSIAYGVNSLDSNSGINLNHL